MPHLEFQQGHAALAHFEETENIHERFDDIVDLKLPLSARPAKRKREYLKGIFEAK